MLAAMRLIGAKNATAEPKHVSSATDMSPRPPTPAAAVLPMLQSSPSGAKVRQVRMQDHLSRGLIVSCALPSCGHMAACDLHVSRAAASCTHMASCRGCLLHCLRQGVILTGVFPPDIVKGTLWNRMT